MDPRLWAGTDPGHRRIGYRMAMLSKLRHTSRIDLEAMY